MHLPFKNTLKALPLILFVWYFSNSHFFLHTHLVNDVWITHSHAGNANHQHTADGFQTINLLSHFTTTDHILVSLLAIPIASFIAINYTPTHLAIITASKHYFLLRAPPYCA